MTFAQLCFHGELKAHEYGQSTPDTRWWCPGGSVLPSDTPVIVKEGGQWPDWATVALSDVLPNRFRIGDALDALSAAWKARR